ncbi:Activator of Hsp90 ATPase N-terminal domain-containing protein [Madurella fahalii]|uniref:Activator of Hsp90 ATPase N-terminal domain-containing protein n=1 Tax=Madurella fahalii TaxID=1157608 RepID=A0ABQ0FZ82_9PEZI
MVHSSRLPKGTTRSQALAMLSDYEFFLSCDPHLDKFEPIANPETELSPPPTLPDSVKSQLRPPSPSQSSPPETASDSAPTPVCYRVTDIVHAIPAGIWDTNVVSTYEFTGIRDGLFVRIRSPLSVVMDTFWEVREVGGEEGDQGLELVEDLTIRCSRLLVGIVKGQCEDGWERIHAKMIARLEGEVKGEGQG